MGSPSAGDFFLWVPSTALAKVRGKAGELRPPPAILSMRIFTFICFILFLSVKVLLHELKEEPLMIERGLKVSPGFSTQIAVTTKHVRLIKAT